MTERFTHALDLNTRGVISLIGAGGKTSLMFHLAKELADSGRRVLTTTTTLILMPEKENSPHTILAGSIDELVKKSASCLKRYPHFSAGSETVPASGKLKGFTKDAINQLWEKDIFDWIIVEADGARHKPVKSTASHEPVVPGVTTHLVLVLGLDAVGTVLDDDHVHRARIFSGNTGLPLGSILDEASLAASIAVEIEKAGGFSRYSSNFVFLNKADTDDRISSGKKIAGLLMTNHTIKKIIVASLKNETVIK